MNLISQSGSTSSERSAENFVTALLCARTLARCWGGIPASDRERVPHGVVFGARRVAQMPWLLGRWDEPVTGGTAAQAHEGHDVGVVWAEENDVAKP